MMSCFAGQCSGLSLSDMVIRQARLIVRELRQAGLRREKVMVINPVFQRDCFTDRWPEKLSQQEEIAAKLAGLAEGLEYIKRQETDSKIPAELDASSSATMSSLGPSAASTSVSGRPCRAGRPPTRRAAVSYVPSAPALVGRWGGAASSRAVAATRILPGGPPLIPSINTQIAAMRASWPSLGSERVDGRTARWVAEAAAADL